MSGIPLPAIAGRVVEREVKKLARRAGLMGPMGDAQLPAIAGRPPVRKVQEPARRAELM